MPNFVLICELFTNYVHNFYRQKNLKFFILSVYFLSLICIIVNVIGCETVYILNLLIIFPLIIQRRRKPRFASSLFIRVVVRVSAAELPCCKFQHSAQPAIVAASDDISEIAIGANIALLLSPAK